MSLFPALHRRPLPTRFGVTLRTTRVLLPQRRILPRTSDGQWNVLHLSAQLFRLSLRECRRFAGVQRRSVVSERRNVLPAIERRFFVRLPAGIQRVPMCRQHGRLSASVSVSERRHLHRRSQQFYLHLQRVSCSSAVVLRNGSLANFIGWTGIKDRDAKRKSISVYWSRAKTEQPVSIGSAATFANASPDSAATTANSKWPPG